MAGQGYDMNNLDTHKYPDVVNNQPGLEVRHDPYSEPRGGWPDRANSVWKTKNTLSPGLPVGAQSASVEAFFVAPEDEIKEGTDGRRDQRRILGLSVGIFWAIIVLLLCIVAAGIGGGVGAGLASKKSSCST